MKKLFLIIQVSSLVVVLMLYFLKCESSRKQFGGCVCQSLIFKAGSTGLEYYTHSCCVSSFPELPQKLHNGDFRRDPAKWTRHHPIPQSHPYHHFLSLFTSWKAWVLTLRTVQTACLLWSPFYLRRVILLFLIFL